MADPFEVRMRFSHQLQHLNASVASAQKAAQYALKYKDMDEDLHSCILEQLERNNMNTRANIMYFIEHFLEMAAKDGHRGYVHMMQRDIIRVVDAVAPDDGSGAANVKVVRKVLEGLQEKNFLEAQAVVDIEEALKDREQTADDVVMASPGGHRGAHHGAGAGAVSLRDDHDPDIEMAHASVTLAAASNGGLPAALPSRSSRGSASAPQQRLDKRQVEQRIEEDRERHKRQRESIWMIPPGANAERDKMWDEASDLGEDDFLMAAEEAEERERCWAQACPHAYAERYGTEPPVLSNGNHEGGANSVGGSASTRSGGH